MAIDLLMAAVLIWLVVSGNRRRARETEEQRDASEKAEAILAEIREITQDLDRNLEEKREITNRLLGKLEEGLERAERRHEQLTGLHEGDETGEVRDSVSLHQTHRANKSIRSLLQKGLSKEEVARHLGLSMGEIELFLKLGEM